MINVGDKFGMLTVLSREGSRSGKSLWSCQCECGNISQVLSTGLTGKTISCGCIAGRKRIAIGQRFGRLVALERLPAQGGKTIYRCACDCGGESEARSGNLNNGITTSCGCFRLEQVSKAKFVHGHGHPERQTRTYRSWRAMRERCLNPNRKRYSEWGGRGITICERWDSFENFLADMGERPAGKTLDRIKNEQGYSPGNCKWSTPKEQANNKRNSKPKPPD